MEKEIWKDVVGYEGTYEVSSLGNVRSIDRIVVGNYKTPRKFKGKILTKYINPTGYYTVSVNKLGTTHTSPLVHRLVAKSFLENPEQKATVNHINGDKLDNTVSNLEWATHKEQIVHAYATGLNKRENHQGSKSGRSKLKEEYITQIKELSEYGFNFVEIANFYNVSRSTISFVVNGKGWKHAMNMID